MTSPPREAQAMLLGLNERTFRLLSDATPRHQSMFEVPSPLAAHQYVLMHPDEVRQVLLSNYKKYRKGRTFRNIKLLMGNGVAVVDGEFWRQQRKLLQPLFHEAVLAEVSITMKRSAARLLEEWLSKAERNEAVEIVPDISHAAMGTLIECIFSEDREVGGDIFKLVTEPSRDVGFSLRFRKALEGVLEIVEQRLRDDRLPRDFLSMIMSARDSTGQPMSPQQLCDEVATLVIAGHETTAASAAWIWYFLSAFPDTEDRLHKEVDVLSPTTSLYDLHAMPFLKNVMFEALRLYPPVWLQDRVALEDDVIGDYAISAGSEIFLPIYFLHRDERFFANADRFDHDRFASFKLSSRYMDPRAKHRTGEQERQGVAGSEEYSFIPFGAGPRRCMGDQFAIISLQIHFATIARRLRLMYLDGMEPEPAGNLRPKESLRMLPIVRE